MWDLKSKSLRQQGRVSSPNLATESGNKTQERETLCFAHLTTGPRVARDADRGYGYTGTWLVSQECSSINKDKAEWPHLSCLPESNGVKGPDIPLGKQVHQVTECQQKAHSPKCLSWEGEGCFRGHLIQGFSTSALTAFWQDKFDVGICAVCFRMFNSISGLHLLDASCGLPPSRVVTTKTSPIASRPFG